MKNENHILGIFFADEDNIVFDKIKFSENLEDDNIEIKI